MAALRLKTPWVGAASPLAVASEPSAEFPRLRKGDSVVVSGGEHDGFTGVIHAIGTDSAVVNIGRRSKGKLRQICTPIGILRPADEL